MHDQNENIEWNEPVEMPLDLTPEELQERIKQLLGNFKQKPQRTGAYYQQEFPGYYSRPLNEHERAISAARGEIRRARRAARKRTK
jgi:Txe/YoeB family toxin of Txe-Axe toxin-antitoxin module